MDLNIFSGNAKDAVLKDGVTITYWRDVVDEILSKIKKHSNRTLQLDKRAPNNYNIQILDSCVHSVGALSALTEREDDLFSYKEKMQAREIILESQNLCARLDNHKK
jgi:hypothetical protein